MLNLDKFIKKVCNSLTKSKGQWVKLDSYYLYNANSNVKIWIANKDYGLRLCKQGNWDFNNALSRACTEEPESYNGWYYDRLPSKLRDKLWKAVQINIKYQYKNKRIDNDY